MSLNGQVEANTLYITLSSRPVKGEYHYGLVATDAELQSTLFHASNLHGPWSMKSVVDPEQSLPLIVLVKIDKLRNGNLRAVVDAVPADGSPSGRTGEAFNCLTWVKDVLVGADEAGVIRLPRDVDDLVAEAQEQGSTYADTAETGGGATVVNEY